MRLTDLSVRKLKAPSVGQKTYFDDALKGFGVRVSQGGAKSFIVMYGKRRRLKTLGRYPDMALTDARIAAKRLQGDVALVRSGSEGNLPATDFDRAVERFLADSRTRNKSSTTAEYERLLRRHFSFEKKLSEVSRIDIVDALDTLHHSRSVREHAFVAIRTLMNWCVRHGLIDTSPVPQFRLSSVARARVLTDDELRTVWHRAEEYGYPYGSIVQLLILTGQRRGEIAGLRRSWIDGTEIVFPHGFTKNKREHRIPVGSLTAKIIRSLPEGSDLLFPARGADQRSFNGWSKSKREFDRPIDVPEYTLHDLRRTYSSNLARLGVPIHVTERLLNHVSGTVSGVAAVYNRYTYADEMRAAVERHESLIERWIFGR
ncbi:site-specific integrase [Hyphomonas sp.]|uniref:tyrosine-type recombinase/integrase n=1 Tax=Alphaproteobacteria TaxID=28211 RepID=UPI003267735C